MKDLYQPVFWCGFALSLSALYATAEKMAVSQEESGQKPVLMQIQIGESSQGEVSLGKPVDLQEEGEELPPPPEQPSTPSDLTPPLPKKTSAFFEAAKAALESP